MPKTIKRMKGEHVLIKSRSWYLKNRSNMTHQIFLAPVWFLPEMAKHCDCVARIMYNRDVFMGMQLYRISLDGKEFNWTEDMFVPRV